MLRHFLTILLIFSCSALSLAQFNFEPGYFIKENGEKIQCLIDNRDWKNNPIKFDYKLTSEGGVFQTGIDSVLEFVISKKSKYVKSTVEVDKSSNVMSKLSFDKQPDFSIETVFLKVLIRGVPSLYKYERKDLRRFFIKNQEENVQPLIYKRYKKSNVEYGKNNAYQQQLSIYLTCPKGLNINFKSVQYTEKSLVEVFKKYYECNENDYQDYNKLENRNAFDLNIRPGLAVSTLSVKSFIYDEINFAFEPQLGGRLGIELETFLPFGNNRFCFLFEPVFAYSYKSSTIVAQGRNTIVGSVDYKSLEFPLGFRFHQKMGVESSLFFNILFTYALANLNFGSSINFNNRSTQLNYVEGLDLSISSDSHLILGIGYKNKSKFSSEIRYHLPHEIINKFDYQNHSSRFSSFHIVLGYRLF